MIEETPVLSGEQLLEKVAQDSQAQIATETKVAKPRGKYKPREKKEGRPQVKTEAPETEVPEEMQITPEQLQQMKALVVQGAGFMWQGISRWIARIAGAQWESDRLESAEIGRYLALYIEIRFPSLANTPEALLIFAGFGYVSKRLTPKDGAQDVPAMSIKM